jgi:hypothetical protein
MAFRKINGLAGNARHGETGTRLYRLWADIIKRCRVGIQRPNPLYSGRIRVCVDWMVYETFAAWAKEHGYADGLEIDRIDNDGDYRPSNCRFVTRSQQMMNRRKFSSARNTSRFKGVSYRKGKHGKLRWRTRVFKHGRCIYDGHFATEREAKEAYDAHAREIHGEFALTNSGS